MNKKTVTVVIPAYQASKTIARAIESVLAQTLPPHEIIVIDDGSPDDIGSALASYKTVTLIRKKNEGAAIARNIGIENATGHFIAFLDADDYWEANKVKKQVEIFEKFPELGLVASEYFVQSPGQSQRTRKVLPEELANRTLDMRGEFAFELASKIWTSTVMIRRKALGSHRFISGLEPAEDRDLWVRIITSHPAYLASIPLATAVWEAESLSRGNVNRAYGNTLLMVRKNKGFLSRAGLKKWESKVFRQWAAAHLSNRQARAAFPPALKRLRLQPCSLEAWWVLTKCATLSLRKHRT